MARRMQRIPIMSIDLGYGHGYGTDDPTKQEPLGRRYGWSALLYLTFLALIVLLFLLVR